MLPSCVAVLCQTLDSSHPFVLLCSIMMLNRLSLVQGCQAETHTSQHQAQQSSITRQNQALCCSLQQITCNAIHQSTPSLQ